MVYWVETMMVKVMYIKGCENAALLFLEYLNNNNYNNDGDDDIISFGYDTSIDKDSILYISQEIEYKTNGYAVIIDTDTDPQDSDDDDSDGSNSSNSNSSSLDGGSIFLIIIGILIFMCLIVCIWWYWYSPNKCNSNATNVGDYVIGEKFSSTGIKQVLTKNSAINTINATNTTGGEAASATPAPSITIAKEKKQSRLSLRLLKHKNKKQEKENSNAALRASIVQNYSGSGSSPRSYNNGRTAAPDFGLASTPGQGIGGKQLANPPPNTRSNASSPHSDDQLELELGSQEDNHNKRMGASNGPPPPPPSLARQLWQIDIVIYAA